MSVRICDIACNCVCVHAEMWCTNGREVGGRCVWGGGEQDGAGVRGGGEEQARLEAGVCGGGGWGGRFIQSKRFLRWMLGATAQRRHGGGREEGLWKVEEVNEVYAERRRRRPRLALMMQQ